MGVFIHKQQQPQKLNDSVSAPRITYGGQMLLSYPAVKINEFHAAGCSLQQVIQFSEIWKCCPQVMYRFLVELNKHISQLNLIILPHLISDPVMRHVRAYQKQGPGTKLSDIVTNKRLATCINNQMQFQHLMAVPPA